VQSRCARRYLLEALTLKRPCCGKAFKDWDDCAAVMCEDCMGADGNTPTFFCGLCLKNFGNGPDADGDCHNHHYEQRCPFNKSAILVFEDTEIDRIHRCIKAQRVLQLLQSRAGGEDGLALCKAALASVWTQHLEETPPTSQ
jgi:hypothetical protein